MVAQALMAAYYVAAAMSADMGADEINAAFARIADPKPFMYIGVADVDQPRVVQVGIPGSVLKD